MDLNAPRFTLTDPFMDPDPMQCPVCGSKPCTKRCRLGATRKDVRRFRLIFAGMINADDPPEQGRVFRDG